MNKGSWNRPIEDASPVSLFAERMKNDGMYNPLWIEFVEDVWTLGMLSRSGYLASHRQ